MVPVAPTKDPHAGLVPNQHVIELEGQGVANPFVSLNVVIEALYQAHFTGELAEFDIPARFRDFRRLDPVLDPNDAAFQTYVNSSEQEKREYRAMLGPNDVEAIWFRMADRREAGDLTYPFDANDARRLRIELNGRPGKTVEVGGIDEDGKPFVADETRGAQPCRLVRATAEEVRWCEAFATTLSALLGQDVHRALRPRLVRMRDGQRRIENAGSFDWASGLSLWGIWRSAWQETFRIDDDGRWESVTIWISRQAAKDFIAPLPPQMTNEQENTATSVRRTRKRERSDLDTSFIKETIRKRANDGSYNTASELRRDMKTLARECAEQENAKPLADRTLQKLAADVIAEFGLNA